MVFGIQSAAALIFRKDGSDADITLAPAADLSCAASPDDTTASAAAGDIPAFLFIHTALSAILVSSTWYLAYLLSAPTSTIGSSRIGIFFASVSTSLSKLAPKSIKSRLHTLTEKVESTAQSSIWVQRLQTKYPNLDGPRVVTSYVEAKVVRLFFKPITVPWRIWISLKLAKGWRAFCRDIISREDEEGGKFQGIEQLTRIG